MWYRHLLVSGEFCSSSSFDNQTDWGKKGLLCTQRKELSELQILFYLQNVCKLKWSMYWYILHFKSLWRLPLLVLGGWGERDKGYGTWQAFHRVNRWGPNKTNIGKNAEELCLKGTLEQWCVSHLDILNLMLDANPDLCRGSLLCRMGSIS